MEVLHMAKKEFEYTHVITLLDVLNEKGWSQRKLSEETGIRFPTINDLCTNTTIQIQLENIAKISETLEVRPEDWIKVVPKKDIESGKVKVHRKMRGK
jgi:DNA-binding Xre family transcriptional regulator